MGAAGLTISTKPTTLSRYTFTQEIGIQIRHQRYNYHYRRPGAEENVFQEERNQLKILA